MKILQRLYINKAPSVIGIKDGLETKQKLVDGLVEVISYLEKH